MSCESLFESFVERRSLERPSWNDALTRATVYCSTVVLCPGMTELRPVEAQDYLCDGNSVITHHTIVLGAVFQATGE